MSKITRSRWSEEENTALAKAYLNAKTVDEFLRIVHTEGKGPHRTLKAYTTQILKTPALRDKNESLHDALNYASLLDVKLKKDKEAEETASATPPVVPPASPPAGDSILDGVDLSPAETKKSGFTSNFMNPLSPKYGFVPELTPELNGVSGGFKVGDLVSLKGGTSPNWEVHLDGRHPTPLAPFATVEVSGTGTSPLAPSALAAFKAKDSAPTPTAAPSTTYVEDWVAKEGASPQTEPTVDAPTAPQGATVGPTIDELALLVGMCTDILLGKPEGSTSVGMQSVNGEWRVTVQDVGLTKAKSLRGALILSLMNIRKAARANMSLIETLYHERFSHRGCNDPHE